MVKTKTLETKDKKQKSEFVSIKMTEQQREKFKELGGDRWLRKYINIHLAGGICVAHADSLKYTDYAPG